MCTYKNIRIHTRYRISIYRTTGPPGSLRIDMMFATCWPFGFSIHDQKKLWEQIGLSSFMYPSIYSAHFIMKSILFDDIAGKYYLGLSIASINLYGTLLYA